MHQTTKRLPHVEPARKEAIRKLSRVLLDTIHALVHTLHLLCLNAGFMFPKPRAIPQNSMLTAQFSKTYYMQTLPVSQTAK
jgi:hypothetical protein